MVFTEHRKSDKLLLKVYLGTKLHFAGRTARKCERRGATGRLAVCFIVLHMTMSINGRTCLSHSLHGRLETQLISFP